MTAPTPIQAEPLITTATITAAAAAVLTLLVAFAVPISADQKAAIMGVVTVAAPLVVALVGRRQVTANVNVVERANPEGQVVAGEANELPTGDVIRTLPRRASGPPPAG